MSQPQTQRGSNLDPQGGKSKRPRTSRPKVKTGCSMCKQRRIKCDEQRPHCHNCVKSKNDCPGYPAPPRRANLHEVLPIAPKPLAPLASGPPPSHPQIQIAPKHTIPQLPARRAHKLQERQHQKQGKVQRQNQNPTPPRSPSSSSQGSVTIYQPTVNFTLSQQEGLYFELFRTQTAGELSGYFDSVFWTRTVLQECQSQSAIRHAVVALGALYKTLEKSTESPPTSPSESQISAMEQAVRHWEFAVQQYGNAMVQLRAQQGSERTRLMASVLLACFDSFIGDHRQAIIQIKTGLGLLDDMRRRKRRQFSVSAEEPVEQDLVTMFTRLAVQAKSYDMAFHFPHPYVISLTQPNGEQTHSPSSDTGNSPSSTTQPSVPDRFHSLMEARRSWDDLLEKMFHFRETMFNYTRNSGSNNPMGILPLSLRQYGMSFQGHLDRWAEAFEPVLASRTAPGISHQEKAGIAVLKMFSAMSKILYLMTFSSSEAGFDNFHKDFKIIVDMALEVVGDEERRAAARRCPDPHQCKHGRYDIPDIFGGFAYSTNHIKASFSADLGIVPPLFVVATKCREPTIRRQAIQLLKSSARREGMWDSELCARIGQWVMGIEEDAAFATTADPFSPFSHGSGMSAGSPEVGEIPLGPGGNARWGSRSSPGAGESPAAMRPGSSSTINTNGGGSVWTVPEEKRVMVRAVEFDLRARFAQLQVGSRDLISGSPDMRSRVTEIQW